MEGHAITLDKAQELAHSGQLIAHLLPVAAALADIPALTLTEAEAKRLQHGLPIAVLPVACRSPSPMCPGMRSSARWRKGGRWRWRG